MIVGVVILGFVIMFALPIYLLYKMFKQKEPESEDN